MFINFNQMYNNFKSRTKDITPEIQLGPVVWLCEGKTTEKIEPKKELNETITQTISN